MRYAVLLYADAALGAGPGNPEWDTSLPHHSAFAERLGERGLAFSGGALYAAEAATTLRRRDGDRLVTDGPFAETQEQLWGYYDVEAPDLDTMLDVCEILWETEHGSVEIRPMFPNPGN